MENMTALLLTQYEKYGSVGHDEFIENFIHEELEVDISMLSDYNEFLSQNHYYDDYLYDDLDEMLNGYTPTQIVTMTRYGDYNANHNYYCFDGYGNIQGYEEYEVINMMKDNQSFLGWYIEYNDLIDWDEAENDIKEANRLIKMGY